jgi:conjugative transposon TraM protein
MNINFKQPKYVLPLAVLPFLFLFFYVYHASASKHKTEDKHLAGINSTIGDVSPEVKKKDLEDKLDAYRNKYKEAEGSTAVNPIPSETTVNPGFNNAYSQQQQKTLDSINQAMKKKFGQPVPNQFANDNNRPRATDQDRALAAALNKLPNHQRDYPGSNPVETEKPKDPMEVFKQQMAYMDSLNKMNDPAYKAEKQKKDAQTKLDALKAKEVTFSVRKADDFSSDFNTVLPQKNESFIMAVIDENVTGYASSRIKLKLLEDIFAGKLLIRKGTYLYALISGFSGQRVTLSVNSIAYGDRIIPVKLEIYDLDGMKGLYVPESAFRDFTKDLGTNSMQGVSIDNGSSTGSQFLMSTADKLFQSTSSAIAEAIRKNKAKIKYNSYIYLIDNDALQNAQKQ